MLASVLYVSNIRSNSIFTELTDLILDSETIDLAEITTRLEDDTAALHAEILKNMFLLVEFDDSQLNAAIDYSQSEMQRIRAEDDSVYLNGLSYEYTELGGRESDTARVLKGLRSKPEGNCINRYGDLTLTGMILASIYDI